MSDGTTLTGETFNSDAPHDTAKDPAKSKLASIEPTKPLSRFTTTKGNDLARNAKAPVWLIKGILEQDKHGILCGASMAFKSFAVLEMAHCIANGRAFMGYDVKKQGSVIYVCGEGSIDRRLRALVIKHGEFNNDDDFHLLNDSMRIDKDDDMTDLRLLIEQVKPVLVVFDTFASLIGSTNENDNGAVGSVLNLVRDTCRTTFKTSSIVVHHTGKDADKGMRGASAFEGNVDFAFMLKRNNDFTTTMTTGKLKDNADFMPIHMAAIEVDLNIPNDDPDELEPITSLVLQKADYVKSDSKKSINSDERKILNVLQKIIDDGESTTAPPKIVTDLFTDSKNNIPAKVTTIRSWLDLSYEVITVTSEPEKEKQAKRVKFDRVRKKLHDCGFIGVIGDYIWTAKAPYPLQTL